MSGYAIIIFSEWIYDPEFTHAQDTPDSPELRHNLGFVYMAFLGFAVAINFFLIILEISRELRKKNRQRIYYRDWGTHYKKRIFDRHHRMCKQLEEKEERDRIKEEERIVKEAALAKKRAAAEARRVVREAKKAAKDAAKAALLEAFKREEQRIIAGLP